MAKLADRILLIADGALLAGVLSLGFLGDALPLPKGADTLELTRAAPAAPEAPAPLPAPKPLPAPAPDAAPAPAAPAPAPEPEKPKAPGQDEWSAAIGAKNRGLEALGRARAASDPARKRAAYADAKQAFKAALTGIEAYRKVCPAENPAVDAEEQGLRSLIFECNKSSPMELK